MPVADLLETLSHRHLDQAESYRTFETLLSGCFSEVEITAVLVALKTRGESADEIAGTAMALRDAARPFPKPPGPVADTCGTGGDRSGTINISTAAAFVAAAGGVPVAKHGNRATTSRCGSADLIEALGIPLDMAPSLARRALDDAGICFLFAPAYHAGVRLASAVRQTLKTRTVFNRLGPLANPARPEIQLMGIYAAGLCRSTALTLGRLGCRSALVVHGGGLDELALHHHSEATLLQDGNLTDLILTPEDAGLPRYPVSALLAEGGPADAAVWLRELLAGRAPDAHLAAVALNAGALFWIAGVAPDLRSGVNVAREILGRGTATATLERLIEASHGT